MSEQPGPFVLVVHVFDGEPDLGEMGMTP